MHSEIFAAFVSTLTGAFIGMWFYGQILRAILQKYTVTLEDGRLTFTPHSPTPREDDTQ